MQPEDLDRCANCYTDINWWVCMDYPFCTRKKTRVISEEEKERRKNSKNVTFSDVEFPDYLK